MENVTVIIGPTASGKTKYAIELAKKIGGEIVSADSMQIYKYMNIGTAKPTKEEMSNVNHYLIDELHPSEEFNVVKFKEMALMYIEKIFNKEKHPIVVGGTGQYINAIVYNIDFSENIIDLNLREKLNKEILEYGNEYMHDKLRNIDEKSADKIHVNDTKRIIRALEVFYLTNKTMSEHQEMSRLKPPKYNYKIYGIKVEREILYQRINKRVDGMIEKGLIEEVEFLLNSGIKLSKTAVSAIGYKEIIRYLNGEISKEEAIEIIKTESRRYAKRQMTWFKRMHNIEWIEF